MYSLCWIALLLHPSLLATEHCHLHFPSYRTAAGLVNWTYTAAAVLPCVHRFLPAVIWPREVSAVNGRRLHRAHTSVITHGVPLATEVAAILVSWPSTLLGMCPPHPDTARSVSEELLCPTGRRCGAVNHVKTVPWLGGFDSKQVSKQTHFYSTSRCKPLMSWSH